jgi:hypothetical protein
MEELENSKNKSSWGGSRENSGRPKGVPNKATLEKKIIEEELKQRILNNAQRLLDAQLSLSQGVSYLYRIDKDEKGKKEKPVLVSDPVEIAEFLDGEYGDGESLSDDSSYYYITTERPNNMSIDSLLDRTFGKPTQQVEAKHSGDLTINVITKIPRPSGDTLL